MKRERHGVIEFTCDICGSEHMIDDWMDDDEIESLMKSYGWINIPYHNAHFCCKKCFNEYMVMVGLEADDMPEMKQYFYEEDEIEAFLCDDELISIREIFEVFEDLGLAIGIAHENC